jgi:hypothetical protein
LKLAEVQLNNKDALPFPLDFLPSVSERITPQPIVGQFSAANRVVSSVQGFNRCAGKHLGTLKAYFDPLSCEWCVWCSYCGSGYTMLSPPAGLEDIEAAWIFQ